jgi:hypothetical protein
MKSKDELKKELHAVKSKTDILDELFEEQQKDLELSIKESENGDDYTMEEFVKITERWRTVP